MSEEWVEGAKQALNDAVRLMGSPGLGAGADRLLAVSAAHSQVAIAEALGRLADSLADIPTIDLDVQATEQQQDALW